MTVAAVGVLLFAAIVLCALSRKREVKACLKIPFIITFFFEANDHGDHPRPTRKHIEGE
jgi:hypothetical protein